MNHCSLVEVFVEPRVVYVAMKNRLSSLETFINFLSVPQHLNMFNTFILASILEGWRLFSLLHGGRTEEQ